MKLEKISTKKINWNQIQPILANLQDHLVGEDSDTYEFALYFSNEVASLNNEVFPEGFLIKATSTLNEYMNKNKSNGPYAGLMHSLLESKIPLFAAVLGDKGIFSKNDVERITSLYDHSIEERFDAL